MPNVTLNHSCQGIPSQTLVDSPKSTEATRIDSQLWGDEVQLLAYNSEANKRLNEEGQSEITQPQHAAKVNNIAIVYHITTGELLSNAEDSREAVKSWE